MENNNFSKKAIAWTSILIISSIPALLWFIYGAGLAEMTNYASATHSFGELFGLVGMTLFALTFVLSMRIRWIEDLFGGLDKVYIAHGILGGVALILILAHPLFLVLKFVPQEMVVAAEYLLPSGFWSVNFGIIALTGLVVLIYITLFTRLKYNRWKFTHEFLGLMFFFAVLHIFLVRGTVSGDLIFSGYYIYASVVSIIGLGAFSYSLFLKNRLVKNAVYTIQDITQKNEGLYELILIPEHKPISYESGQFVFLRFYNENLSRESHPFSIASKTNAHEIKIIIKTLGDFTKKISNLRLGEKVSIEGPYGRFNVPASYDLDQIWIAAGIGITPFLGMVEDILTKKSSRKIDLYYTVKDDRDFIGWNTLSEVQSKVPSFKFIPWNSSRQGRITVNEIVRLSRNVKDREILLCGPESFKEKLVNDFESVGVKKSRIHEEAFEFR